MHMTDKNKPHIGMKLWEFDENRRVYARDKDGKCYGSPIWREHWVEVEILGETSVSWLVGGSYLKDWPNAEKRADKLPKRNFPGKYAVSEEEIDKRAFVEDRYRLAKMVDACHDYDTLKKVEAILKEATEQKDETRKTNTR